MREEESNCGSHKSSHFLLGSRWLKKASFLGSKNTSPLVLTIGSVSINYDGTCKDWPGMYLPRR